MKDSPDIEELLNGLIDEELTERQEVEVQRLISHDAEIAQRLRELQKCKMLVGSLPRAEAPGKMLEQIKASLERRTPLEEQAPSFDEREGARHLLARKVLAVAAMVGLVAVLAAVVYTIVTPESGAKKPVAGREWRQPGEVVGTSTSAFYAKLELKTDNPAAADAFINKAIEDNGLSDFISPRREGNKSVYAVSCSREALGLLLADLGDIWAELDSATLFVEAETAEEQVVVENVSPKQVADLLTPPKPRLTRSEAPTEKPVGRTRKGKKVHLTIVVGGSE
jgi:hypothetical protein